MKPSLLNKLITNYLFADHEVHHTQRIKIEENLCAPGKHKMWANNQRTNIPQMVPICERGCSDKRTDILTLD